PDRSAGSGGNGRGQRQRRRLRARQPRAERHSRRRGCRAVRLHARSLVAGARSAAPARGRLPPLRRSAREARDAREGRRPGVLPGKARRRRRHRRADRGRRWQDAPCAAGGDHAGQFGSGILDMSNPLQQTIEALAKEKGIEPDVVISAIEEAVATASRKYYKTGENLKTRFNLETGQVDLFALKQVVQTVTNPATEIAIDDARQMYQQLYGDEVANSIELGDEMEFPKPTEVLGRIAAQTAKQVIFQKVREAERENIFAEYNQRIGEVVNGTVKRFENGDIIIEVGRVEAVLPRKEQSRAESYAPADRIRSVIKGVNRSAKGPQIVLSRTDPALLIKLFEQEVTEIYAGTGMIVG